MNPRKRKPDSDPNEDELKSLILAQQRDARGAGTPAVDDPSPEGSVVTREGAIRSLQGALRELVAPAPDEVLTRPPEDDEDDEDDDAASAETTAGEADEANANK